MRTFLCTVVIICLIPVSSANAVTGVHALRSYPHRGATKVNVLTSIGISYNRSLDSSDCNNGISVTGSKTGIYFGLLTLSVDCKTLIFKPSHPFLAGETVSVYARSIHVAGDDWTSPENFTFSTANTPSPAGYSNPDIPKQILSIPDTGDLPKITVTKNMNPYPGEIYFANIFDPSNIGYRIRVNTDGAITFAKRTIAFAADYKANSNGTYSWVNYYTGYVYISDTSDKIIDSLSGANGYHTDVHEFRYTPEGNYMFIADDIVDTDMSKVVLGGFKGALITFPVIQEFDKKHNLVFEWNTKDHFSIFDGTHQSLNSSGIDFCHMNSIDFDFDSNLLVSSRNMDELTKIDRQTGEIIWRMGGYNNEFNFINDKYGFTGQHDFRRLANGNYTTFDDGNFRPGPLQFSRALEYKIDPENKTVTQVWEYRHKPDRFATGMGSVQRLPNGNTLIGWGFADTIGVTEVDSLGNTHFELNFGPGTHSYRVYKFDANYITSGLGGLISATDHDFDTVAIGDTMVYQVQITNTGAALFNLLSASQLNDQADFTLDPNVKFPFPIKPNNTVKINIYFHPRSVGQFSDSILWATDISKNADIIIKNRSYFKGYGTMKSAVMPSKFYKTITISPNPVVGNFITIAGSELFLINSVCIYDMLGKEIYRKDISALVQYQIPIQDLSNGVYYMRFNSTDGSSVLRFSRVK